MTAIDLATELPQVAGLDVVVRDHIAVVAFARPEKLNALTGEMMDGLPVVLASLASRAERGSIRCLVLRGEGRAFCAGGDLATVTGAHSRHQDALASELNRRQQASLLLATMPIPTIASVHGVAAGAGMALALACDLRVFGASAKLVTAFAQVAFSGDYGGSYTLQKLIGPAKTRELYFTGGAITADDAKALGVANAVVSDERLSAETMALARKIADGPPLAIARMKATLNYALTHTLEETLTAEASSTAALMHTQDSLEALDAFRARRKPTFEGR